MQKRRLVADGRAGVSNVCRRWRREPGCLLARGRRGGGVLGVVVLLVARRRLSTLPRTKRTPWAPAARGELPCSFSVHIVKHVRSCLFSKHECAIVDQDAEPSSLNIQFLQRSICRLSPRFRSSRADSGIVDRLFDARSQRAHRLFAIVNKQSYA